MADGREAALAGLSFRGSFRKYQRLVLSRQDTIGEDRRYHIVAPPGSGKTVLGLELIRRFGAAAVVFAPTSTIQRQWDLQLRAFSDGQRHPRDLFSDDAARLAAVNVFTYQLISVPAQADKLARGMAERQWIDELLANGRVPNEAAARHRIEALARVSAQDHRAELARRYVSIRRDLMQGEPSDIARFLHPNALALVDALVERGIGTVVLDECHHLLDHWALVLRYLVSRLDRPKVVGLTATLPSPEDEDEYENYTSLLGDVDFEVPTPAVVKEGNLAPYRDLVYFVEPTPREDSYLRDIQSAFEHAVAKLIAAEDFRAWAAERASAGPEDTDVLLRIAALRCLRRMGLALGGAVPPEAERDPTIEDWTLLIEPFALDVLRTSAATTDHERLRELRAALLPFGLTLTERGLRQSRSAGDLVLALSEAKDAAVATILEHELRAIGDRLRAVVITDFEKATSGVARVSSILGHDAGSARRTFAVLALDPRTSALAPVLVTGTTVMVPETSAERLCARFEELLRAADVDARCELADPRDGVREVVGRGPGWTTGQYVRMVTAAFEAGETRCLVGTRGLLGEGWDALRLNTLIDLTSVTTSTSVQQLRGRTMRLDPDWPRKVAHNWDVICVAPGFERGDADLRRFERRHARFWGIVVPPGIVSRIAARTSAAVRGATAHMYVYGPTWPTGAVTRGVSHVDGQLAYELATAKFKDIDHAGVTRRMLQATAERDRTYDLWRVGEEYSNFISSAARLDVRDLRIRTVYSLSNSIVALLRGFWATVIFTGVYFAADVLRYTREPQVWMALGLLIAGSLVAAIWRAIPIVRHGLIEQPPDAILRDVGRAVLAGLRDAGLISGALDEDGIAVLEQPDGSFDVRLESASEDDARTFITAYRETFAPIRDQRYLIMRDDGRLPAVLMRPFWLTLRGLARRAAGHPPAYHPVPDVLGTRRERADAFAAAWARYVGGGALVHTRGPEGRAILLKALAQRRPDVKGMAFETWC